MHTVTSAVSSMTVTRKNKGKIVVDQLRRHELTDKIQKVMEKGKRRKIRVQVQRENKEASVYHFQEVKCQK